MTSLVHIIQPLSSKTHPFSIKKGAILPLRCKFSFNRLCAVCHTCFENKKSFKRFAHKQIHPNVKRYEGAQHIESNDEHNHAVAFWPCMAIETIVAIFNVKCD